MNAVSSALHRDDPAQPRGDWTRAEIRALFELPFPELMFRAQDIHRRAFDPTKVQLSTLLSIKTGGCPEDCAYCPQAAQYDTGVKAEKLMDVEAVLADAARAKAAVAKVRPEAVAMLDKKLLSDSTLGDILSSARAEARKR